MSKKKIGTTTRAAFDAARADCEHKIETFNGTAGERSQGQLDAVGQAKNAYFEAFQALVIDMGAEGRVVFAYASAASNAVSYLNQAAYASHEAISGAGWWNAQKLAVLTEHVEAWKTAEAAFAAAGCKPVEQKVISDSVGIPGVFARKIATPIYNLMLEKLADGEQPVFYAPTALDTLAAVGTRLRLQPATTGKTAASGDAATA